MKELGAVIFLSIIFTFGGCGGEPARSTKVPVPPVGKQPAAPAKTPPPLAAEVKVERPPVVTYVYDPKGKPDPFKPLIVERPEVPLSKRVAQKVIEEGSRTATPLEKMELNQLKLVALIWNIKEPKAMVEDGTGKGYILANGTSLGKNKGRVSQITSAGVVVSEQYETSSGKFGTRAVTLKLYPD
jgi:type IV pilus assembly protein PilP